MKRRLLLAGLMASAATAALAQGAPPPYGAPISIEDARRVIASAMAEAARQSLPMAIAVVDSGGHLVAFERADNTQIGSIRVAQEKARTAVEFRRPTKVWEDGIASGRNAILGLGVMPIEGGVPLVRDGRIIGAIGVSGGTAQQDGVIAQAGVAALR